jgi:hypothetical protein
MTRVLRFFQPEVEAAIKVVFIAALASAYLLTFTWGYEARQQAERWREIACAQRLSALQRVTPGFGAGGDACEALDRAGLDLAVVSMPDGRRLSVTR